MPCYTQGTLEDSSFSRMTTTPNSPLRPESSADRQRLVGGRAWGNFQLLAMVGRGSFGAVYRAWDPSLQREVALKILLPGSAGDEEQFEALLREARALASVRHPNIVPISRVSGLTLPHFRQLIASHIVICHFFLPRFEFDFAASVCGHPRLTMVHEPRAHHLPATDLVST